MSDYSKRVFQEAGFGCLSDVIGNLKRNKVISADFKIEHPAVSAMKQNLNLQGKKLASRKGGTDCLGPN